MANFAERRQAFEARFAHDEESRFLVGVRRDKLFAGWAAERLRLPQVARPGLVAFILALRDGPGQDRLVLGVIAALCLDNGDTASDAELAGALETCGERARQQLMADRDVATAQTQASSANGL